MEWNPEIMMVKLNLSHFLILHIVSGNKVMMKIYFYVLLNIFGVILTNKGWKLSKSSWQ